jgi:hypothetical protein
MLLFDQFQIVVVNVHGLIQSKADAVPFAARNISGHFVPRVFCSYLLATFALHLGYPFRGVHH